MVVTFVRLKLRLLAGAMTKRANAVGLVVGALVGVGVTLMALAGMLAARRHGTAPDEAAVLATLLGLGWVVGPLLLAAADESLDPTRLVLLPLRTRDLVVGLLAASFVGVAAVLTVVASLGMTLATARSWPAAAYAVVCSAVLVVLVVTTGRAVTALANRLVRGRRGRDIAAVIAALVGLVPASVNLVVLPVLSDRQRLRVLGRIAAWTPWGALASAPSRAVPVAAASLAYAVLATAAGFLLWVVALARVLVTPDRSGGGSRKPRRPSLNPLRATSRRHAGIARELRVLRRDPRRLMGYLTGVVVALAVVAPLLQRGDHVPGPVVLVAVGGLAVTALQWANAFGPEGSAYWIELVATTGIRDSRDDLTARQVAAALLLAPVAILVPVALAALAHGWTYLPATFGIEAALAGLLLGAAMIVSIFVPMPLPTGNAFATGDPGRGCIAGLAGFAMVGVCGIAVSPLAVVALVWRQVPAVQVAVLVGGAVVGVVGNRMLTAYAARRLVQRGPELLHVLARTR